MSSIPENRNSLGNFIKKNFKSMIVPLCMIVLGIFFIVSPGSAVSIAVKVFGILLVIVGVVLGCTVVAVISPGTMILAVALVLIGILCLAASGSVASLILKIIGLFVLVNSFMSIHSAYVVKGRSNGFIFYIINDVLTLILGFVLLFFPLDAATTVVMILGIFMTVMGISNLITVFKVYRDGGRYIDDGSGVVWEE